MTQVLCKHKILLSLFCPECAEIGRREFMTLGDGTPTEDSKKDVDAVNHPPHYKAHPSGIECIEVTRHMTFNLGNAVKYLWRADHKGTTTEDLRKAIWYINDEIGRLEGHAIPGDANE